MKISKWKIIWAFLTGSGAGVMDYILGLVNTAADGLSGATKDRITATINFILKALSVVKAVRIFIPVKWQMAYDLTIGALDALLDVMSDMNVTGEELSDAVKSFKDAYAAWMGEDDDTCQEL